MLKASSVHTCVIYDPKDGQIVHVHKEISIGRLKRTEAEIEARARMFASRQAGHPKTLKPAKPRDINSLKAVFVRDTPLKNRRYRIDKETLKLVEI